MGFDCKNVILDSTRIFGYQVFHTGHVHCDPHPGNLLIREMPHQKGKHQVVLIDHGLYVDLPPALRKEYARLWVAMSPPADKVAINQICASWGIGSVELFQTIIRAASSREQRDPVVQSIHSAARDAKRTKDARGMNNLIKENLKKLLQDTSKFPKELILIARCMNYIRAANWTHGSPIDRVAVLANAAHESVRDESGSSSRWIVAIGSAILRFLPGRSSYSKVVEEYLTQKGVLPQIQNDSQNFSMLSE